MSEEEEYCVISHLHGDLLKINANTVEDAENWFKIFIDKAKTEKRKGLSIKHELLLCKIIKRVEV